MFNNKNIFSLLLIMIVCMALCSCESTEEIKLKSILKNYSDVFTDSLNECATISKNILQNKNEFLHDLFNVLSNDTENLLILADKKHFLSPNYVPLDLVPLQKNPYYLLNRNDMSLRKPVEEALKTMAIDAQKQGKKILVSSCYRSYEYQKKVYERNVRQLGQVAADRESAKPGTSQHQLGSAVDFGSITDDFAETATGKWLAANAPNYGFSLSFPQGYESVTGYRWESWHYRYIGKKAVEFQQKWFNDVQQYMLEFIYAWRSY